MKRYSKKEEPKSQPEPQERAKWSLPPSYWDWENEGLPEEDFEWARRLLKELGEEPRRK